MVGWWGWWEGRGDAGVLSAGVGASPKGGGKHFGAALPSSLEETARDHAHNERHCKNSKTRLYWRYLRGRGMCFDVWVTLLYIKNKD